MADEQRVYILIGGGGGIGRATAARLREQGATLVLAGRDKARLQEAAKPLEAQTVVCDATDFSAVDDLVQGVIDEHGRLDGIANLAGSIIIKPAHLTTPDEFAETMALNATTAFATVRAAAKAMGKTAGDTPGGASIVLMSSCASRIGLMNHEAIAAAKGAVIGLTQAAAATYAGKRVRVNCVAPGLVDTPMASKLTGSDQARKASEALHPLGRLGEPDDVAPMVSWLLGPESGWVTGQVFGIDGGLSAVKGRGS